MVIYRLSRRDGYEFGEHRSYEYYGSYKEAKNRRDYIIENESKEEDTEDSLNPGDSTYVEIEKFEFPVTRDGMLRAVNYLGCHPDNG